MTSASTSPINALLAIPNGTILYATVRATNGVGLTSTATSDGVTVDTTDATSPPAPSQFIAVAADQSVILEWTPSGGADIAFYRVWWKPSSASWDAATLKDNLTGGTATNSGLVNGTAYDFMIKAVDRAGNESGGFFASATPQPSVRIQGVPASFATVQAAVDAAIPGQTVILGPGIYTGDLVLNAGVSLAGASPRHTLIAGTGPVIQVLGSYRTDPPSTISDLTIENGADGIQAGTAEVNLLRVIVHHMTGSGITASAGGRLQVVNCTIVSNGGIGLNVPAGSAVTYSDSYLNVGGDYAAGVSGTGNLSAAALFVVGAPPVRTNKFGRIRTSPLPCVCPRKTVTCRSSRPRMAPMMASPAALQVKYGNQSLSDIFPPYQEASRNGGTWVNTMTCSYRSNASGSHRPSCAAASSPREANLLARPSLSRPAKSRMRRKSLRLTCEPW